MTQGVTTQPAKRGRARLLALVVALLLVGGYVLVRSGFNPFRTPPPEVSAPAEESASRAADIAAALDEKESAAIEPRVGSAEPASASDVQTAPEDGDSVLLETDAATSTAATGTDPSQADTVAAAVETAAVEAAAENQPEEFSGQDTAPHAAVGSVATARVDGAEAPAVAAGPAATKPAETAPSSAAPLASPDPASPDIPATPPEPQVVASMPRSEAASPAQNGEIAIGSAGDVRPATGPAPQTAPPGPTGAAPSLPRFDVIRIDAAGAGLVAGRAAAGSNVAIMSGSKQIATAEVDAGGQFVAFIQTPATDEGQVLSIVARDGNEAVRGAEDVLVLPGAGEAEEASAPTIVKASETEVRVVQPSVLGKVAGVTLDTISYDETGAVRLSGRAPGAQPIRIYVDGASAGSAESTGVGSWDARLTGIEEGRYVLRVDALRPDGTVASRAESPFQRVYPTAEQQKNASRITVQPGNTLWVMARERYGRGILYTQIFAANAGAIRDPDLIYPGQIFSLPEESEFVP